jgi:hypothetical protein
MSLAAETRDAVRSHPFLFAALRAGVVNYRAAAEFLDLEGEIDAVATALRRFEAELPARESRSASVRVEMKSGIARTDDDDALLSVGEVAFSDEGGSLAALLATGDVDAAALAHALGRLTTAGVEVTAAAVGDDALAVVVGRRDAAEALRVVEATLADVPDRA